MYIPPNLLYTRHHLWVKVEDGNAVVGVTDPMQEELGEIDSIELPAEGDELEMDIECLIIHHGIEVRELPAPLTGRVLKVNKKLMRNPELIHLSPYKDGWLYIMECDEPDELDLLYSHAEYLHELENRHGSILE